MRRTQISLTEEQYQQLKRESERSGRSIADIGRSAVDEVFDARKERSWRAWTRNVKHFPMFPDLAPPY
jgi:hypothetical protein